eukprot:TRINITY_DN49264_c0_g1_i2.p2 TRINITY_DN49264_c0_g1~~TRINITY_DN49264_c0_g1_i2.p2  ORF type:complete len:367 (+),score=134.62 TRINITY_DN49264_c0_g1_i2:115-1215(+)
MRFGSLALCCRLLASLCGAPVATGLELAKEVRVAARSQGSQGADLLKEDLLKEELLREDLLEEAGLLEAATSAGLKGAAGQASEWKAFVGECREGVDGASCRRSLSSAVDKSLQEAAGETGVAVAAAAAADAEAYSTAILRLALQSVVLVLLADALRRRQGKKGAAATGRACGEDAGAAAKVDPKACLLRAAIEGDFRKCEALLTSPAEADYDIGAADMWGCNALHVAAAKPRDGGLQLVQSLLRKGAAVDARDAWDETPLHLAARGGNVEVCKALLLGGADVDASNMQDLTPLVVAAEEKREVICRLLRSHGASTGSLGLEAPEVPAMLRCMMESDEERLELPELASLLEGLGKALGAEEFDYDD